MQYPEFESKGPTPCSQVDPEIFFPDAEALGDAANARRVAREAKRVCLGCPYMAECLKWAMENEDMGVWGGTTQRERNAIKRNKIRGRKNVSRPLVYER